MIHYMNQTYSNTMLFYPQLELYSLNYSANFIEEVYYYDFEPVFPQFFHEAIKRINVASVPEVILTFSLFMSVLWLFYVYTVTIPRLQSLATPPVVKLVKEQQTTTTEDTLLTRQIEYDSQINLHEFIQQFEALGGTYSQLRGWTVKKFIRKTGGRKGKPYFLYYNRRGKEFRSVKRIVELFDI